ncbi:MAG: hypothetical protein RLZZ200_2253 [Pseudomonadota bacterium]|jgi:two-component system response regulator GlrR
MTPQENRRARILVVDDDPGLLRLLTIRLRTEGHIVEPAASAAQAMAAATRFRPDLVISDLRMEPVDGIGLLKELQQRWPGLKVILLTAHGTIPDAVQATQMGAFGFLTKPVDKHELLEQIQRALKVSGFTEGGDDWRAAFVTRSPLLEETLSQAHRVAGTDECILLSGETGTGKELLARAIHLASPRREHPFLSIGCGTSSEEELDGELFGMEGHEGLFRAAQGGTILLDDIEELPASIQQKLLRAIQEGTSDVRVVAASHGDLKEDVAAGRFREDLYYRLSATRIEMPPLSRRREDIPLLVADALARIAAETGIRRTLAPEALELLAAAEWPGNVRQLQNVVRQSVALAQTPVVPIELLRQTVGGAASRLQSFDEARDDFARGYLTQLLQATSGNVSQAARLAKRNRTDFYKLLSRHALVPEDFKQRS